MNTKIETAIEVTRWASIVDHLKNNRIEYLLLMGILHIVGVTAKAYEQVNGVCL
jgi:hypothetical protein